MTTINVPLLLKLSDTIAKHPEQFRAQEWDCGTTACFAGWLGRLMGPGYLMSTGKVSCGDIRDAVGLSYRQTEELFYWNHFTDAVWNCDDPAKRAALAAACIHAFLDRHAPGWRERGGKI